MKRRVIFVGWHVRPAPSFEQQISARAMWWQHSTDRLDLLREQAHAELSRAREALDRIDNRKAS